MKMKKMVLSVKDSDGNEIFIKDPANPDLCMYSFALFGDVGNHFDVDIVEVDVDNVNSSVSVEDDEDNVNSSVSVEVDEDDVNSSVL